MQVGLIGLGKMGHNLGLNLMDHGHEVIAYDISQDARRTFEQSGGQTKETIADLVLSLNQPRVIWVMVPAGKIVDEVLEQVVVHLDAEDIVIDGGNSHYQDTLRRAKNLFSKDIYFFDVGTSGGISGARHGACYMIGGDKEKFAQIEPLFRDTAVDEGYLYTGKVGSGHYSKMVHNGIEYGMMAAIGEGFEVLHRSGFEYDYRALAHVWSHGSVIRGWLMELTEKAFEEDPQLDSIRGVMHSSGEGKWTVDEALNLEVPTPVIAMALMMRYRSRENDTFTGKVVAALRNQFGGHAVEKA